MVQLKGFYSLTSFSVYYVSIPYGTIKSSNRHALLVDDGVSIPYGTIKRHGFSVSPHPVGVSIPYGTIKSLQNKIDKLLTILTLSNYKIEKND